MSNLHESPIEIDPRSQLVLDYLEHHFLGYPFLKSIDQLFVLELLRDFPHLDLLEEIKTFRWYFDDQLPSKRRTLRASLRRWMTRSKDWNRSY
jgi:hypothetical protein